MMSERDDAWTEYAGQFRSPADDAKRGMIFRDGYDAGHASAEAKYALALSAAEAERDLARGTPERPSHLRELAQNIDALNDGGWATPVEGALGKASRALQQAAEYAEYGPLAQVQLAYRTYRNTRDLHELARAVGQILNGPDDVQPESEWKTVERPDNADG